MTEKLTYFTDNQQSANRMAEKMRIVQSVSLFLTLASLGLAVTVESRFDENGQESFETNNQDLCLDVLCHAGQDCLVHNEIASCICKKSCPDHDNPVCGSNGMTFPNHCELHRTACLQGKKISVKHNGMCKGVPTQSSSSKRVNQSKPVVCYEDDREDIRSRLIGWLKTQNNLLEGVQDYNALVKSYFDKMDENSDRRLDAVEFREFVLANQTMEEDSNIEEYENSILQGLCADALISVSDDDSDLELTIDEFMKCLNPEFKPPKRGCGLDDLVYSDGTEISTNDCNSCVCACGHWVCTALKCDDTEANQVRAQMYKDEAENHKLIVNGEEAKELLNQEISRQKNKQGHHIQREVLPLLKTRHPHKHRKHGSRKSSHKD